MSWLTAMALSSYTVRTLFSRPRRRMLICLSRLLHFFGQLREWRCFRSAIAAVTHALRFGSSGSTDWISPADGRYDQDEFVFLCDGVIDTFL